MQLELGSLLICPSGTPNTPDKTFEMHQLHILEARQQEISHVSKVTAPELMQSFVSGYGISSRALVQLEWELTQASKYLEERKAIVNLEIAPEYLQKKGLATVRNPSGSQDQREAVLAIDKEYQALQDRYSMIEAAVEYLKTKVKSFEMSYQSVKKVYDSLSGINALTQGRTTNGNPSYGIDQGIEGPLAIGKPRY